MRPRWFSWKPKGLEKFECRQKYDRAPEPEQVIISIEVKGHVKGKGVGTFAARFLFRREQLEKERPTVDAVMVEAFAKKWLGALVGHLKGEEVIILPSGTPLDTGITVENGRQVGPRYEPDANGEVKT